MPTAPLYPLLLRIEGRRCLVVGGGKVAARKARGLLAAGARVRVVSPELSVRVAGIDHVRRRFRAADVPGMALAFAATDDPEVNRAVASACRRARVPVNVADAPDLCDFQVPAVVRKGPLTIALSTGGASPALARSLKRRVASLVGEGYAVLAAEMGRLRVRARCEVPDPARRRRLLRRLAGAGVLAHLDREGLAEARKALRRIWRESVR